jgi:hypothetical protein
MPSGQQYATNVPQTTLTSGITSTATAITVISSANWPNTPFTAAIDLGQSNQEPIDVTVVSGVNWTVTRAIDGTTGFSHAANASVTHVNIGRDNREARAHIDANGGSDSTGKSVHGLTGNVVGTTDTQTLTNKTLTTPTISSILNSGTVTLPTGSDTLVGRATTDTLTNKTISAGNFSGNQTMGSGNWTGTGNFSESTLQFTGITGAASSGRYVGMTTLGPPTTGTFVTGDIVTDRTYGARYICTASGSPGTWIPVDGRLLIGTTTPSGASSTTFTLGSSVPAGYNHLRVEYVAKTTGAVGVYEFFSAQINGVSTTTYDWNVYGRKQVNSDAGATAISQTSDLCGYLWTTKQGTNGSGRGYVDVPFAFETTFPKGINWQCTATDSSTSSISAAGGGGTSAVTGAVTSLTFTTGSGNFTAGSTFRLYALV